MLTHYMLSVGPAVAYAGLRERDLKFSCDRGVLYGLLIFLLWGAATHAALVALERDFDLRPIGDHAGA